MLSRPWARGATALAIVAAAAVALSGCSLVKKKHPTLAYEERPVELLFSVGASNLDRHNWNDAVNYFREVERQHPYSEWSRRSILMTAYAHYEANNYAEAIADADRFISLYPGNAATPYAFYIKAICYFEQIIDVGRDQAATEQALAGAHDVRIVATYVAEEAESLTDEARAALATETADAAFHYSRRSAAIFRKLVEAASLAEQVSNIRHVAISADAAAPLIEAGWKVDVASAPDEEAMLAMLDTKAKRED